MRQVAAVKQVHAHHFLARLKKGKANGLVCRASGVRLDVRMRYSKKLFCPVARQVFHYVDKLVPAVIALAGITFRVFVGENRTHCLEHAFARVVFGGNHFQPLLLARELVFNGLRYCRVVLP